MASLDYDYKSQFIIVGDSTVGKTSIIKKYFEETYSGGYLATVGVDFFTKDVDIGKKKVRIKVWDTAGQERFKSLTNSFFKNAQGILLVYDVNNKESFYSLKQWIESIIEQLGEVNTSKVKLIILGNKCDLENKVTKKVAIDFCDENKIKHFETSARNGSGIEEAFNYLILETLTSKPDFRMSELKDDNRFSIDKNFRMTEKTE